MMDNLIDNVKPDYYIIKKNIEPIHANSVYVDWIYALQGSDDYIYP